jgi:hypothetical protein
VVPHHEEAAHTLRAAATEVTKALGAIEPLPRQKLQVPQPKIQSKKYSND